MLTNDSLPSYELLFGELDFREGDDARSVYSPAAYFVELLELLERTFNQPSLLELERRPDLKKIVLNAENTFTEQPYLDIVNEILELEVLARVPERRAGDDAYEILRTRSYPFRLPFSLHSERLRKFLHYLQVTPEELYRLFAPQMNHDVVAREYLGLSPEDVAVVAPERTTKSDIMKRYGLASSEKEDEALAALHDVARFSAANELTGEQLNELLHARPDVKQFGELQLISHGVTTNPEGTKLQWASDSELDPWKWFDLVNRFLRLARLTGMAITDLDLVLSTCCGGRLDKPALRTLDKAALRIIAVVIRLQRDHDLSATELCRLVAALEPKKVEGCSGDILAAHNRDYRFRLARTIEVAESDIVAIVRRYREKYSALEPGPFDRENIGSQAVALLHRVGHLASTLSISVDELFDVLVALDSDPSVRRYTTFAVLGGAPSVSQDCYQILEKRNPSATLWLVQTLFAVVAWMQASGFDAQELADILGGRPQQDDSDQLAVLDSLNREFRQVALSPELFVSPRFGQRAAKVIYDVLSAYDHGVVSTRDDRLLRIEESAIAAAAYDAVTDLGVLAPEDFMGLGLDERLTAKIFNNLVYQGHLQSDGVLVAETATGLRLADDFSTHAETLFTMIAAVVNGTSAFFPSDLAALEDLTQQQQGELYDNLIVNGYVNDDGDLLQPDFFLDADNVSRFAVNADLSDVTVPVLELLADRIARFGKDPLPLDPAIFADLRLTEPQTAALVESLRFNGYLNPDDTYRDKPALAVQRLDDFGLALEFYPHRRAVLDAMKAQIADFKAQLYTYTPDDFAEIADEVMAQRVLAALDGDYVSDGRVLDESLFADPEGSLDLGPAFTTAEQTTVFRQICMILADQQPYRLHPAAVTDLGFDDEERDLLFQLLGEAGYLGEGLAVAEDRLGYFRNVTNALDFVLPGLADYSKEIFFLLHAVANEMSAAMTEIDELLAELAQRQQDVLYGGLADAFGVPAATAAAICKALIGGAPEALGVLIAPVLAAANEADEITAVPADPHFRRTYRRIRRFALLAGKLGLDATEVSVVFQDQDLVGKFPEPLALPADLTHLDAVLKSFDGKIYLFGRDVKSAGYWTYSATTYALTSPPIKKELKTLSPRFAGLVGVDAAFTYPTGTEWIVGRDDKEVACTFTREPGHTHWVPKEQVWGKIRNNFVDPARIDAAFVDENGRTYLFSGNQYIRYSSADYTVVDEGYPRSTTEWWEHEELGVPLPPAFRTSIDACFQGRDNKIHIFSGDRCLTAGADATDQPIASRWGRVRNNFENAERVDAAYADQVAVHLYSGNQVVRYSDCIENNGVRVDDGYLQLIRDVPPEFEGSVEAAFTDQGGRLHLFKNGRTVATIGDASAGQAARQWGVAVPTEQRWGRFAPDRPLLDGTVDAAFVGLDGKTYLFSGQTYLRYSSADYSVVDLGYPQVIARDWGGLNQVDAAFVLDGKTYLFGIGGLLFDLPVEQQDELDSGRLTPALRRRFLEHGLSPTKVEREPPRVANEPPRWRVSTQEGLVLRVKREGKRVKVYADGDRYHVRYSTRDYATPDAGYPKPLSDNWWNLPEGLELRPIDAVFTGRDNRTYLFSGGRFIWFDARHRWWSEPRELQKHWASIPTSFSKIDAAFVGQDGRTYLFSGERYIRYSTDDYTMIDDRYPATISTFWGNVVNNLARTGRVDATLVRDVTETVDGENVSRTYTCLFSGNQYVRYEGVNFEKVQDGYPRSVASLASEPGMAGLRELAQPPDGVDAAFADQRTAYLFRGRQCHVVSSSLYRYYDNIDLTGMTCAFIEDGTVVVGRSTGWTSRSALEARPVKTAPYRPRILRTVPPGFQAGLDSVLNGADGNTYLFKGPSCFNVQLNREYLFADEWGRPRNTIYQDNAVDAAFVGRDGKTYLFSGDQYVAYPQARPGSGVNVPPEDPPTIEGDPLPISARWGGLTSVTLAYVRNGKTYLFEKPDADGTMRYLVYSGTDYSRPDEGYPAVTDSSFWQAPDGFPAPDAVLFEGDTMLLLSGKQCVSYHEKTGRWSYPRPIIRIWPGFGGGLEPEDRLRAAFTALDGVTYFFFGDKYARYKSDDPAVSGLEPIRDRWGVSRNPFVTEGGTVDAAFVWRGEQTYLFSGDNYVRYSGPEYRYVDTGYPKKIAGNLRREEPFANLPDSFEDDLPAKIDAVIANNRTVYVFLPHQDPETHHVNKRCHAVSRTLATTLELGAVGRVRNNIAERQKVDAALVTEVTETVDGEEVQRTYTYLFSGDQYVRYSGTEYGYVDDGYPKAIGNGLAAELGISPLPGKFLDGIDAAFRGPDGKTYLFKDKTFLPRDAPQAELPEVNSRWGKVRNEFTTQPPRLDAAFVAPGGELYAFRAGQFIRYQPGKLDLVEEGYPRIFKDDWGDLPDDFEAGPDGAFVFEGRTYLLRGDQYVRYSGEGYRAVDRTFPQDLRHRWSNTADYRLGDVHTIVRFVDLVRSRPNGLAEFFLTGAQDPYQYLSDLLGWDVGELRWARRNSRLLTVQTQEGLTVQTREEPLFEIEFLLKLVDLFAVTDKLGAGTSEIYTIWSNIFREPAKLDDAATDLRRLLQGRTSAQDWRTLSAQIDNELNVLKRDALVPTVIALPARPGSSQPQLRSSRDLFEHFLIDVDMGSAGRTSPVREAIAATQLFVHRYLLDLEEPTLLADEDPDDVKRRLKAWWAWMKNYRTWEANRKVFLYPENYLRPELRSHKTPAFEALENDLLQGEITPENVYQAYKRYLDEYTEVSRLVIAGGYVYPEVYTEGDVKKKKQRLVLFGRTRTEPRRYYYRTAEFRDETKLSTTWDPWFKVDVQINSDRVEPVHAFGRVFVFWPVVEVASAEDPANTSITTSQKGDTQHISAPPSAHQVKIYYSFCNLNQEWVPAQVLAVGEKWPGRILEVSLTVQASRTVPGGPSGDHDCVVVTCSYEREVLGMIPEVISVLPLVVEFKPGKIPFDFTSSLTPELYTQQSQHRAQTSPPLQPADLNKFFIETLPSEVSQFNTPADSEAYPWFSVDLKGSSFLCRHVAETHNTTPSPSLDNEDKLPALFPIIWHEIGAIDAAFQLPGNRRYFFFGGRYFIETRAERSISGQAKKETAKRWGIASNVITRTGVVDAALVRQDHIYLFSGTEYYRYPKAEFGTLDTGYPKSIQGNTENLPQWTKVDAAFTTADHTEYFYSRAQNRYVTSGALQNPQPLSPRWPIPDGTTLGSVVFSGDLVYLLFGNQYLQLTEDGLPAPGSPKPLDGNEDGLPQAGAAGPSFPCGNGVISFNNTAKTYAYHVSGQNDTPQQTRDLGIVPNVITRTGIVNAAYVANDRLYLTSDTEFVRYTLAEDGSIPPLIDEGYPKRLARPIKGVLQFGNHRFIFTANECALLEDNQELDTPLVYFPLRDNWYARPDRSTNKLTGVLDSNSALFFFFSDEEYTTYPKRAVDQHKMPPVQIIRLTSSTAYELNKRLLTGGIEALLSPETQEIDELPAFSADPSNSNATTIKVSKEVWDAGVPTSSHLDFQSPNGLYYWEIFFHAPLLIAQALNNAQRFDEARRWYEYIFDPTERTAYWRFLPFLAIDVAALVVSCRADMAKLTKLASKEPRPDGTPERLNSVQTDLDSILTQLEKLTPAFQHNRELTETELNILNNLVDTKNGEIKTKLKTWENKETTLKPYNVVRSRVVQSLQERVAMIGQLQRQYELRGDQKSLIAAYRNDPLDPHAIAALRPIAYRRAVVMAYIDNLLDWGDMLFRQYTAESIDEARMLYIFAYDLLGDRPHGLGPRALSQEKSYECLDKPDTGKHLAHLTAGGSMLEGAGAIHAGIVHPYFFVPDNSALFEYWTRVEDRLRKIRQSLDILGVSRPVPLFEPPADVMALVQGVASGAALDQVIAGVQAPVPHYRFAFLFRKAQELVDKLRQFGGDLLSTLDRRDAEELSLLQNRQEAEILAMTRGIKEAQVRIATENLLEMRAARDGAGGRVQHYEQLIAAGMSPVQKAQIAMMSAGAAGHLAAGWLKIGAAVATGVPQILAGPFIMGTEVGGKQFGGALDKVAEMASTIGEGLSMLGEVLGVVAEQQRTEQDWKLQLAIYRTDVTQLGHQVASAELQVAVARRELDILNRQADHLKAVATFLTDKFAGAQLYSWMAGRLSGLYFQTYHLAYEMARSAERAYQFERGGADGETSYIQPTYWESRRNGLLAGESLSLDLERLSKAYLDGDTRGLEITKRVSLLALDPLALLGLTSTGRCEFALQEALFDRDFPGHFRRQIRTLAVTFEGEEGPLGINATLTQLDNKTVLAADPKAVKFLLDPKGSPPTTLRSDWRAGQQIALSDIEEGRDNNGVFELRFDDDRYLPFEGTGAVSRWRLETGGRRPPAGVLDVTITVKYTAEQGGEAFATAVKGMLKPYPAARFFDVAAEFPDEWEQFLGDEDTNELVLPFTPNMFPAMSGRQITGIYAKYALTERGAPRFLLGGDKRLALTDGKMLQAPGLSVSGHAWRLVLQGDKTALTTIGLVLAYRASAQ